MLNMDGDIIDVEQMLAFEAKEKSWGTRPSLLQRNDATSASKSSNAKRSNLHLDHASERDLARGGASFRRDAMRARRTAMMRNGEGVNLAAANDERLAAHLIARSKCSALIRQV